MASTIKKSKVAGGEKTKKAKRGRPKKEVVNEYDASKRIIKLFDKQDEYTKELERAITNYISTIVELEEKIRVLENNNEQKNSGGRSADPKPPTISKTKIEPRKLFTALHKVAKVRFQAEIICRTIEEYYKLDSA